MVMHGMVDNAPKQLKNKKPDESWPHHQDKHGNWVPCASNPCKMHGGSEVIAKNPEEAFEKANSVSWDSFGMNMNQKNDNNDGMNDKQKVAWDKLLQSAMDEINETMSKVKPLNGTDDKKPVKKHVKLKKSMHAEPSDDNEHVEKETGSSDANNTGMPQYETPASNAGIITSNRHLMKQRAVIEQRLKDAGIDIIERPVPSQEVIDEMRNNGEYIRDNPLVFNVDSKVNTQELAHAIFKGADFGDEHYNELIQRSNEAWDSMTSDEQAAIYQYTGSAYSSMNKALYKKNYKSEKYDTKKMIADMSSGLAKTENVCQHDTVLYRKRFMKEQDGEYTRSREETTVFQALARVTGKKTAKPTFTRANYMSTANRGFNDNYHDQVRYIISIPKGTHGISVEEHSIHSIEDEFIIDKGYDYEVVGVFQTSEIRKHSNGITNWETGCSPIIALRVIPKKNKSVKLGMTA